jgi:hypothetical protein
MGALKSDPRPAAGPGMRWTAVYGPSAHLIPVEEV